MFGLCSNYTNISAVVEYVGISTGSRQAGPNAKLKLLFTGRKDRMLDDKPGSNSRIEGWGTGSGRILIYMVRVCSEVRSRGKETLDRKFRASHLHPHHPRLHHPRLSSSSVPEQPQHHL